MKIKFITLACLLLSGIMVIGCSHEGKSHEHEDEHEISWNQEDHKLVKAAISDYVEGLYLVDSTRIEKSVDSTLRKIGYWYDKNAKIYRDNLPMTYDQLVRLAARWNKDGKRANEDSPKTIEIYDVNTKTASAKLTAEWGVDYFHLAKVNDQWKIINVIWQSILETEE